MTNPVDAAIAAARQNAVAAASEAPTSTSTAVSAAQPQARRSALAAVKDDPNAGLEGYMKINLAGITVGDKTKIQNLIVKVNVSKWGATAPNGAFSVGREGEAVQYFRTYDGVTETKTGRPWATVVQEMTAKYGNVRPHDSYDCIFELTEDVGGLKAGATIGYSTTITGNRKVAALINKLVEMGLESTDVEVELVAVEAKSQQGKVYGTFEFGEIQGVDDSAD